MKNKKLQIGLIIIIILAISFFLSGREKVVPLSPEQMNNDLNIIDKDELIADVNGLKETVAIPEEDKLKDEDKKEETIEEQKIKTERTILEDYKNNDKKDKYLAEPVPKDNPKPVEWQEMVIDEEKELIAILSVSCKTILNNIHMFNEDKLEVLPEDGIIYPTQEVIFYEGESVFDVLLREMKNNKIHMEFTMTPIYNSNYIAGINNIYEFDCGELSGWMYRVNGWFPNYGVSRYLLQEGDKIELIYTCDLGRDIGGTNAIGGEE